MSSISKYFSGSLLFILVISGCGGGGGGNDESTRELLRIVHAAPTLGTITVFEDGKEIASGLTYGHATPYLDVDETQVSTGSTFSISVTPESVVPIVSVVETVTSPYFKTLLVTETSAAPVLTFIDDTSTELPGGQGRIRFVNANAAQPSVDVYVTQPNTSISGKTATVSALALQAPSDQILTPPANYRVRITAAASPDPIFDSGTYPIDEGDDLTFYFLEKRGGGRPYTSLTVDAGDR